uniref:Uncharacterized protein n=1 Tax=Rhodopseudomonas palustris (strain DX-1) TaxID=652103 RepID=E6VL65_RHOPX
MKKYVAKAGMLLVISPVLPFYGLVVLGEWIDSRAHRWTWADTLFETVDRIEEWGRS